MTKRRGVCGVHGRRTYQVGNVAGLSPQNMAAAVVIVHIIIGWLGRQLLVGNGMHRLKRLGRRLNWRGYKLFFGLR